MTRENESIMPNINIISKRLATLIALVALVTIFIFLATPRITTASAADDGATEACKGQKSNQEKSACVFGFAGGYENPKTKATKVCDKYSVEKNKKACVKGVVAGRALNKKETDAAGNKVVLENGTDPSITACGDGPDAVGLRFDLGCQGAFYEGPGGGIGDLLFSIIRFLSYGVGIAVVIAIIASGIQYTTSEGNPEATQQAKNRIQMSIISLIIYVFIFSISQFLIPGGLFT